ncbi:hypothetical protein GCM10010446_41420 [Streptomyces enissocaesilis]|uniref:Uncharacterized protein n=1 Tax=Streptomyces enissocaesilis TaxID=332589 RepID=A0ABP6JWC0_9ACTN
MRRAAVAAAPYNVNGLRPGSIPPHGREHPSHGRPHPSYGRGHLPGHRDGGVLLVRTPGAAARGPTRDDTDGPLPRVRPEGRWRSPRGGTRTR